MIRPLPAREVVINHSLASSVWKWIEDVHLRSDCQHALLLLVDIDRNIFDVAWNGIFSVVYLNTCGVDSSHMQEKLCRLFSAFSCDKLLHVCYFVTSEVIDTVASEDN